MRDRFHLSFNCPHCGEPVSTAVDFTECGQERVEDCPVCCKPMVLSIDLDEQGEPMVAVMPEDP